MNRNVIKAIKKVQKNRIREIKGEMFTNDFEIMFGGMLVVDYEEFLKELTSKDESKDNWRDFADWLSEEDRAETLQSFVSELMFDDSIQLIFSATSPCSFCNRLTDEQYTELLNEMSTEQIYWLYRDYDEAEKLALIWRLQNGKWEMLVKHISTLDGELQHVSDLLLTLTLEDFTTRMRDVNSETLKLLIFAASEPLEFCNNLTAEQQFNDTLDQMDPEQIYRLFEEFGYDEEGALFLIKRLQDEKFKELIEAFCTQKEAFENLTATLYKSEELKERVFEIISELDSSFQAEMVRNADDKEEMLEVVWKPELLEEFSETEIVQLMLSTRQPYRGKIFADFAFAEYTNFWEKVPSNEQIAFLKMAKADCLAFEKVFDVDDFSQLFSKVDSPERDFLVFEILLNQGAVWVKEFYKGLMKANELQISADEVSNALRRGNKLELLEMAYRPDPNDTELRITQRITLASQLKYALEDSEELEKYEKVFLEYFSKEG